MDSSQSITPENFIYPFHCGCTSFFVAPFSFEWARFMSCDFNFWIIKIPTYFWNYLTWLFHKLTLIGRVGNSYKSYIDTIETHVLSFVVWFFRCIVSLWHIRDLVVSNFYFRDFIYMTICVLVWICALL